MLKDIMLLYEQTQLKGIYLYHGKALINREDSAINILCNFDLFK